MENNTAPKRLHILWTSGDSLTARMMVLMYATNSKLNGWWDEVTVIVWGAAAKLAAEDGMVWESIRMAQYAGVRVTACSACARQLGVTEQLEALGIEVTPWGEPLSALIKEGAPLLTV